MNKISSRAATCDKQTNLSSGRIRPAWDLHIISLTANSLLAFLSIFHPAYLFIADPAHLNILNTRPPSFVVFSIHLSAVSFRALMMEACISRTINLTMSICFLGIWL